MRVFNGALWIVFLYALLLPSAFAEEEPFPRGNGYRGIWYMNQPSKDEYVYKYSGGLGTYCAKHIPMAEYAPAVEKTFFVYGGTKGVGESKPLLIMVSYYDHKTGTVPHPVIIMEKGTEDAHHNPTLCLDGDGFLWIFVSSHGGKDGYIWKSRQPYSIDSFELVMKKEFSYPQPRYMPGYGIVLLFTQYTGGRELYFNASLSQFSPETDQKIVGFGGHYETSGVFANRRGTAFNWHPPKGGLNARTNLYYMETPDQGKTWTTADGKVVSVPLDTVQNPTLVHDYQSDGWLVYLKDLNFDAEGRPVILYLLAHGYESGPSSDPRVWTIAHWTGRKWEFHPVTQSDHNYDMGSLYTEDDSTWRIIAPTEPGPQRYGTGGEIALWISQDQGKTWHKEKNVTHDSSRNHTYVRRPVNAHPGFYAFWADGDAFQPSPSNLYFTDRDASAAWILPEHMTEENQKPARLEQ